VEAAVPTAGGSRGRRLLRVAAWLVGVAVLVGILQLLGVDVRGWLGDLWDQIRAIPTGYLVAGLTLETGQTVLTGLSYYGILAAAFPGEVSAVQIVAAYAAGVAANGFLPANLGTLITLLMFVAIIPSATFASSLAAYLVQKIFFTLAGAFVYLYLFLSVPGSFDISFGNLTAHPVAAIAIVAGAVFLIVLLARVFWRQVQKLWAQAKAGGVILTQPRRYLSRVFLPSFLGYLCKLAMIGVFLAAFAIPVTFNSIMWVVGSGSLANVASFTPGAVGVTQATNALALKTCCDVPHDTAVAYSTAQQLITTAWGVVLAIILVVYAFGWTGGKVLVSGAYGDAKTKSREMRDDRRKKRDEKKAAEKSHSNGGSGLGGA
jgi:uncharacterized membrane protein YbhN (UPF0104 family)